MATIYKVLDLKIESYILESAKFASKKLVWSANNIKGLRPLYKDVIPLPTHTRKWTVNRSTFKHKRSRDTFELSTHKRLFSIVAEQAVAEKFIKYAVDVMPAGVILKVTQKSFYPIESYYGLNTNFVANTQTVEDIVENLIKTEALNKNIDLAKLEDVERTAKEGQTQNFEAKDQSQLD